VGRDRVLRIYRRDAAALLREREILSRKWRSFRVPRILDGGVDFLLLEFVNHTPLQNSSQQGEAVGRALSEIQQSQFECCGSIDKGLRLAEQWKCFPKAIEEFIRAACEANENVRHRPLLRKCVDWIAERKEPLLQHCHQAVLPHGDFKASNLHWTADDRLLVLDWEFAYAGPPLMDIGQLIRWGIPEPFRCGFYDGYRTSGCEIPNDWEREAEAFDLVNLVALLAKAKAGSRQELDCAYGIEKTLGRQ